MLNFQDLPCAQGNGSNTQHGIACPALVVKEHISRRASNRYISPGQCPGGDAFRVSSRCQAEKEDVALFKEHLSFSKKKHNMRLYGESFAG